MMQDFWDRRKVRYAFHAESPRPRARDQINESRYGPLLSVVMHDRVMWGFQTREAIDRFLSDWPRAKEIPT